MCDIREEMDEMTSDEIEEFMNYCEKMAMEEDARVKEEDNDTQNKFFPFRLKRAFDMGFALGLHTFPGSAERTPLGKKLYILKYKQNKEHIDKIIELAVSFIKSNKVFSSFDLIIPMPPSKPRKLQPVLEIARGIKAGTGKFIAEFTVAKIKETPELKSVKTYEEKKKIIKGAYGYKSAKARSIVKGKTVLVVDDLFDTGATADEITRVLKEEGEASKVFVLAITRTKGKK